MYEASSAPEGKDYEQQRHQIQTGNIYTISTMSGQSSQHDCELIVEIKQEPCASKQTQMKNTRPAIMVRASVFANRLRGSFQTHPSTDWGVNIQWTHSLNKTKGDHCYLRGAIGQQTQNKGGHGLYIIKWCQIIINTSHKDSEDFISHCFCNSKELHVNRTSNAKLHDKQGDTSVYWKFWNQWTN